MTKTGQTNHPAFHSIKKKAGSEAYGLYVTYTMEGPIYDAVCLDAELDEFEVEFDDGCARILTSDLNNLMLMPENLLALADMVEQSEQHHEEWLAGPMGIDFQQVNLSVDDGTGVAKFAKKYKDVLGIRSQV